VDDRFDRAVIAAALLKAAARCCYCGPVKPAPPVSRSEKDRAMNTAVVTGAGSGVGRAVALRFASEGWNVALVGRRAEPLRETIALSGADESRLAGFACDVSAPDAVAAMGDAVLARFGSADVLVNSAGINVTRRSFDTLSLDDWHAVLATNLHGAYYCVRAFLPGMRARRTGTIVNINSDVGKAARDLAGAAYVSSKFGLRGLTQQINAEERSHGIRACSICPRDINTPLLDKRPQPPSSEARAAMLQPEDLAACVWLVATAPPRAVIDEISLSSR
jgi:NAD(P)-dependent dehydrogenase (short-subunit alcohol dehydrogenase family)